MRPLAALLDRAARELAAAGVESARLDARVLLAHVLGIEPARVPIAGDLAATPAQQERFAALIARRARREPVAYLTGEREFWSLPFQVDRHTLIPRPDSETLVAAALTLRPDRDAEFRVLDLGTGSGCLLLAILSERPRAWGVGVDRDPAALRVARANAIALGLGSRACFVACDWTRGLSGAFDVIVANPPYLRDDEIAGLEPDVREFEPRQALTGGRDGLAAYRALAPVLRSFLAPSGVLLVEIGMGQVFEIARIFQSCSWLQTGSRRDLSGVERCLIFRRDGA